MKIQIDIHASPQDLKDFLHNVVPEIELPKKPFSDITVKEIENRIFNLERIKGCKIAGEIIDNKRPLKKSKITTS